MPSPLCRLGKQLEYSHTGETRHTIHTVHTIQTMQKHSKTADLLKVLGGKIASNAKLRTPRAAPAPRPAPKPRPQKAAPRSTTSSARGRAAVRGRDTHIWLHDEDQKLIQELAVWLLSQRKRINTSLVLKTVLRAAKTGPHLLAAYDEAVKVDARLPGKMTGTHNE